MPTGDYLPSNRPLPSPQWSTTTLKSLDITLNIPSVIAMDAEDSPWGGLYMLFPFSQFLHAES